MYVLGALAVVDGGLPLWWAVAATVIGQAFAFGLLVVVAQPGVDHGLPGQVAFDQAGSYRYVSGVNLAALLAVAAGASLYSALPHAWPKVVWGPRRGRDRVPGPRAGPADAAGALPARAGDHGGGVSDEYVPRHALVPLTSHAVQTLLEAI